MNLHNSHTKSADTNFIHTDSINYESVEKKLKMALSSNFATHSSNWNMVGLMFYSIHKKTGKLNNDLSNLASRVLRKANDSNVKVPEKLREKVILSHVGIDVNTTSVEDMIQYLMVDNISLLMRVDNLIRFAKEMNANEYIALLEPFNAKCEDNRIKLSSLILKL